MSNDDRNEFAVHVQDHINKYIRFADKKLSILLTGIIAFIGLYANLIGAGWTGRSVEFQILSAITLIAGVSASIVSGWAVYPRTPGTSKNLILWESIQNQSMSEYQRRIGELQSDDILENNSKEAYQLASVATDKYRFLRISMILTAIMFVLGLISWIIVVW